MPIPRPPQSSRRAIRLTFGAIVTTLAVSFSFATILWPVSSAANRPSAIQTSSPVSQQAGEQLAITWRHEPLLLQKLDIGGSILLGDRYVHQIAFDSGDDSADFAGIEAINASNGETLWQVPLNWSRNGFAASTDRIFTLTDDGSLLSLNAETGEVIWSEELAGQIATIGFNHGKVYSWSQDNALAALDAATGTMLWQTAPTSSTPIASFGDGFIRSDPMLFGDSVIVTIDGDFAIQGFNLDGSLAWTVPDASGSSADNQPRDIRLVASGNTLVRSIPVGGDDSNRDREYRGQNFSSTAYDMTTSDVLWSLTQIGAENATGSIAGENLFYFAANGIEAADTATPEAAPIVDAGGDIAWPEWTPTAYERQNYFPGATSIFAIDAQTGEIAWEQRTGAGDFLGVNASAIPGVWASTADGKLVHLSAETGALLGEPFSFVDTMPANAIAKQLLVSENGEILVARVLGAELIGISIS